MVERGQLSVVIPTYRRPVLLEKCLRSLAQQELDRQFFEVVVVDDGSADGTPARLAAATSWLPNLRWVSLSQNSGPATARNRGVSEATGDLVLFLDDDIVADRDLLGVHLRLHRQLRDEDAGVLGHVAWHPEVRITPFMAWLDRSGFQFAYETWLRKGWVEPPYAAFYTANLSLPRQVLLDVGGFDERFPYANYEDMELAYRLAEDGFRLYYEPSARAYHARAIDLATFVRRMGNEAESSVLFQAIHPELELDTQRPRRGLLPRRRRLALRVAMSLRRGDGEMRARYFRAEIAAAYSAGLARGAKRFGAEEDAQAGAGRE